MFVMIIGGGNTGSYLAKALLEGGHTVYAHCNVGAGRTPSVVVAYLHWREGWNLDDAIEQGELFPENLAAPDSGFVSVLLSVTPPARGG